MMQNHFRHPLNFNFSMEGTGLAAWNFSGMYFLPDPLHQPTYLSEKVIFIMGLSGGIWARDPDAGVGYDVTDKVTIGLNCVISNGKANASNTTVFLKLNQPYYPAFIQLNGPTSTMTFTFYFYGGDWPAPPPANMLILDANFNVHFETEQK